MMTEIIPMSNGFVGFRRDGRVGQGWHANALPHTSLGEKGSCFLLRFVSALLAHGLAIEFQTVRIVNDAVENTVGYRNIPNLFVPVSQGHLRGENQRAALVTVVADFQKVPPLAVFERSQ